MQKSSRFVGARTFPTVQGIVSLSDVIRSLYIPVSVFAAYEGRNCVEGYVSLISDIQMLGEVYRT